MSEEVGAASGAAVSPTVADVLYSSPVGPLMDQPVADVLSNIGLPQLPALPEITLPDLSGLEMPTLPTIDLSTLIEPVTSLLSSFGSGSLGDGFDPTSIFSAVTSALSSASSNSKSAMQQLSTGMLGQAADAAQIKSDLVQADYPKVLNQGNEQRAILLDAQRVVAQGYAELTALISRFIASATAAGAFIWTPAGLPTLIALATEAISEGTAIVAKTRVELAVKTAEIAVAGIKIPITGAPNLADAATLANNVISAMEPYANIAKTVGEKVIEKGGEVVSAGSEVVSEISSTGQEILSGLTSTTTDTKTTTTDPKTTTTTTEEKTTEEKVTGEDGGAGDGGGGGGGGGLGLGGVPTSTSPLNNVAARVPTGESSPLSGQPRTSTASAVPQTTRAGTSPMMGGMGAGAGRAGDAGESGSGADRSNLVTGAHGDEVVGQIEGVSIPVVGAVEVVEESPDKALTL
ncbi:hypothetical protein [Nocardia sp. NPDC057668]|uniref:hypothetical protein n=1 Tax=Nocardia sp. NPDC057668 TaxID=3346202 RepID=UPI0036711182